MDSKDKLVLKELQRNCRQTIAEISKKTNLPRDVVQYRIKKLEESGVIISHHTFINHRKIGYPIYSFILFSLFNPSVEEEKKFYSFLKGHKNITYAGTLTGNWDVGINICAKDFIEHDKVLKEIRHKFPKIIKEFTIGTIVEEIKSDWMVDLIETK